MDSKILESFFALCKTVNSPRSLSMWLCAKYGEFDQLVDYSINPRDYDCPQLFKKDYLVTRYLKKFKYFATKVDRRAVALRKFNTSEALCKETNEILQLRARGEFSFSPRVERILHTARRKIARVVQGFNLDHLLDNGRFGPGATFSLKGKDATIARKVTSEEVTYRALPYAQAMFRDPARFRAWTGIMPDGDFCVCNFGHIVNGNRVITVPKDATTDRTIAAEPSLNVELQLSVGSFLRRRLKAVAGIDLDSQFVNQELARVSHAFGLSTIDLSNASDSISKELIYELLPIDFAIILDDLRSHNYHLDNHWTRSEKFSSMGNGYTFELETLLFWALASSCSDYGWASVYGDDIIICSDDFDILVEVFRAVGFSVNVTKSYKDGRFFESCGKHYFDNVDVTPIYQKEDVSTLPEIYRAANRIIRYAYNGQSLDVTWKNFYSSMLRNVPIDHVMPITRWNGDLYDGDDGLCLPFSDLLPWIRAYSADGYFKLPVLEYRSPLKRMDHSALLAYVLRQRSDVSVSAGIPVRRSGTFSSRRRWFREGAGNPSWV